MENNTTNNSSNQNRSWEDNNYTNQGFDSTRNQQQNQNQGGQNWSSQPYRTKLPADPSAMVLAIIATCVFVLCCCFGGPILAFILSVIGFILANNSVNKYKQNAEQYDPGSFKKVSNAKIFNLVVGIVSLLIIGLGLFDVFDNAYRFGDSDFQDIFGNDNEYYDEELDYEESEVEDDWYEYEEEIDSMEQDIDSIEMEIEEIETVIEEVPED
ncbi:MAG: hypothetical protein ACSHWW_01490 [Nonlabens sp.]|uniref:hypothetical protein n=1 Tax=Nonlabens sp. TaxID=1888209 RepID=UPI003EF30678